jgi:hypothetical protein
MKSSIAYDIRQSSPLKINRRFGGTCHRQQSFMLVSCMAYSLILNMEATRSSETSVDFHRSTRSYIPKDRTLQLYNYTEQSRLDIFKMYSTNISGHFKFKSAIITGVGEDKIRTAPLISRIPGCR